MVQIIQRKEREPLGKSFSEAIVGHYEGKANKEALAEENRALKDQFGIDLSGVQDSNQRKAIVSELLKTKGKEDLFEKKQGFLGKLFGGKEEPSEEGFSEQILQEPGEEIPGQPKQTQRKKFDPASIPDEDIVQAAAIDPVIGRELRAAKDAALKRKEHEESMDLQSFTGSNNKYIEKVLTGYEAYKRDEGVLNQMEQIAAKGKLTSPLAVTALEKLGLPIGVLSNPDSEQFEKLSQELMKNITGTYGSRILQTEVVSFMKSIPTLKNSPEGQKRLIRQWQILNEGKKAYYDAYKDIKKKNPKRLPPDLHEQVLEAAEGRLDKLSNEFRKLNSSVKVKGPDGNIYSIPESELDKALEQGGELL